MNINDKVLVRLTPQAHARLMANHAELFRNHPNPPAYQAPKQTSDGWYEFRLWELMTEFRPHIHPGMTGQYFVRNQVRIPGLEP